MKTITKNIFKKIGVHCALYLRIGAFFLKLQSLFGFSTMSKILRKLLYMYTIVEKNSYNSFQHV